MTDELELLIDEFELLLMLALLTLLALLDKFELMIDELVELLVKLPNEFELLLMLALLTLLALLEEIASTSMPIWYTAIWKS